MYDSSVTQKHLERIEAALKIELHYYDPSKLADRVASLSLIAASEKPRPFTTEEKAFIRNEQILSKIDFRHFANNYCKILLGGINQGGIGTLDLWESQFAILNLIGRLEKLAWEAFERNEPCDGILIALNKARQLGATMICRAIIMQRVCLWDHTAGFSASVDDDKVLELYDRDKRIYDNLPFFLQPSLDAREGSIDQQAQHIKFGKLDSSILYQTSAQKSGLGQGRKFDVSHLTEAASFDIDGRGFGMIEHDFFPTLPQNPTTFCVLESTPQGRGNAWHTWTEMVRKGKIARWKYLFVPVYIEKKRYRRTPPPDWIPAEHTLNYAKLIEESSPEVVGYKFIPERSFLYWWETTRREYAERGSLNIFLTNYAATPEQSFQFITSAALDTELLETLATDITEPVSYEFERSI